jgi:hypothetical protein
MPEHPTRRAFLQAAATGLAWVTSSSAWAESSTLLPDDEPPPLPVPEWVRDVTRMCFAGANDVESAAKAGAQVLHTNLVWPYFPLAREGGGLSKEDAGRLKELTAACHQRSVKLCLGLPPFPPVALVQKHPDWRVHADPQGSVLKVVPREDNLGTRVGCNLGPWGDYLIDVCAELVRDYQVDGFSFDGNYHPPMCWCPACQAAYRSDRGRDLPARVSLDDVAYREYLVWRGDRLEAHYRRLQGRIKKENPDAVLMSWTVNAGRYGHFLHSPRAMPTRLNRLFDLPMQEWWLDETNQGGSVAPAFGAAYLRATMGDRTGASEPYLMARGNPYGTDSFPAHERLIRTMLALTNGCVAAESLGWPGHAESARRVLYEVGRRAPWLTRTSPLPWAALLVSERTRQFYAYKDIADRFLPHVFGAFRAGMEEHLPLTLINDWDVNAQQLAKFAVLILPNAAALSEGQVAAVREFVRSGGGLVATGETSLCDELGRPRADFALADVFGVRYEGRPRAPLQRPALDANFAVAVDENYWKQRSGVARLTWGDPPLLQDGKLRRLVPTNQVNFRGPLVRVSEPENKDEVIVWMRPEGGTQPLPALVLRRVGAGRVAYFAAAVDAALWSYAYPYQRRLLARAVEFVAHTPAPVVVQAPLCVQAGYFVQAAQAGKRLVVHLFNGVNTAANHGLPGMDVPLREETIQIPGIEVHFRREKPTRLRCEPGGQAVKTRLEGDTLVAVLPPLELHTMLVAE